MKKSNKAWLLTALHQGATVITPNKRLSIELLRDFAHFFPQKIQDKPVCLSYSAFLHSSFLQCCHRYSPLPHPLILTDHQCRHLWRLTITSSLNELVNEGLLHAVEEAWTRCHFWRLDFCHPAFSSTPQTRQFQNWAMTFQQKLDKLGAITEEQIANYLLSQSPIWQKKTLIWACFDDYTPQQQALQQHFDNQGYELYHYDLSSEETKPAYCYEASDENDELQQLIGWLKERLAQGEKHIGVVVPDLQTCSLSLQRRLQQEIPADQLNVSLGQALSDYPLVAHAFCWLQLDKNKLSASQARLLLHSPYLACSQSEMLARAQFMEDSTVLQEHYFTQDCFVKELQSTAPELAKLLKEMVDYPEEASIQAWITLFKNRLKSLGFPGEYPLNSATYQCYQRFSDLFDEFKQLTLLTTHLAKRDAQRALIDIAKSIVFQPETTTSSVQILGLLEASGCTFDSLWVTGMTDQCLPQKPRLSAFIPLSLQRENRMPYADPEKELQLAQKTVNRLNAGSDYLVFSYPRSSEDKPNLRSPLLTDLIPFHALEWNRATASIDLIETTENYQLPLTDHEKTTGGTAILANQAKCPFRAFAAHRLHAKTAKIISDGPDARERGQLIHQVMELLWQALTCQTTLLALDENQVNEYIESAIKTALQPLTKQRPHSFSSLIQEVELTRLKRLVKVCLDWERQRPSFIIEALEQDFTINLAGIDFRVRVDRLDRMENDKKWVIDYKSSLPASLPWKEERPKEPQLLLYALLDEAINGLLFAQLKSGQLTCKGLSEENCSLVGISTIKKEESWSEYRQHWQTRLNELATEFAEGHCPPKPLNTSICQQCDYQNLCRYHD
ncbi:PD-(D/E)XK nuclease family protein [Legionella fairfieldensis]|uniref:PD-(D/E)XK nuclease family protein n=1 Tax=Legionella fairfieldensis TaxID=45064 RepID=UPI0005617B4A|nr:PD-(D/E)XK nuclease family protein [Legionella fairfieldensis]